MVPCIGTAIRPDPAVGAAPEVPRARVRAFGRALPPPPGPATAIWSAGTNSFTAKRLPLTSTSTLRSTFSTSSSPVGAGVPRTPVRSSVSSTHLVERSEEHTSELQSLMRISYAVFCLKQKTHHTTSSNQGDVSYE